MGQRRLGKTQSDDMSKRPQGAQNKKKSNITALNNTTTRKGEVFRAQRRTSEDVNVRASQHMINVPVNKSVYNGYDGKQFSLKMQPKKRGPSQPVLRVIPIGGVGEMGIGKNMNAIEFGDEIVIIDMGFLFAGADYPGINYFVPDITWLEENKHKIKAHIFTHGHLDHIGAFKHLIDRIPAPIYASKFTIGMLKRTMEESSTGFNPEYNEMDPETHEIIQVSKNFSVELVRVNHSIPDSTAVVVRTPAGVVIDSGDWRFEDDPADGKKFDLVRMTEIASKEGVLLFMNESTNCESEGSNDYGEKKVQQNIGQVMEKYQNNRMVISCFSSQLHRIQLILEEAKKRNRKVAFAGYSMLQNLEVALRAGAIKIPKDVVVKMENIVKLPDGKVTIVCTGSQGEFNAVLNRMATGAHKFVKIKNSDVILFSSNPIPGNEKYVVRTVDDLMREGSIVVQNNARHLAGVGPLHLSGHGYYEDHVKLINALKPKFYMPIHGEFHMLVHNAELAEKVCGIDRKKIFVCDPGDILEFGLDGSGKKAGRIPVGGIMYDDSGAIVSEVVLKDRIHMSQEGMFIVVLTVARGTGRLLSSPDIISRGFIYMRDSEELMNSIRQYVKQKVVRAFGVGKKIDLDTIKKEIKDELTHILYDQTRRTPIVIPVINEIAVSGNSRPIGRRPVADKDATLPKMPAPRRFPPKQVPDTETVVPRDRREPKAY